MKSLQIPTRVLLLAYTSALVVGLFGVFFSYHSTVTSSTAWIKWGNQQAWKGDSLRLVALYLLAALLITTSFRAGRKRSDSSYEIRLSARNLAIATVFLATVLALNFYYYPIYFEKELLKTVDTRLSAQEISAVRSDYFDQVYKPFFSYIFYALAIWIGIILPTFLLFLDGFVEDRVKAQQAIDELAKTSVRDALQERWDGESTSDTLNQVIADLGQRNQRCVICLKILVQRYLPALLVVAIGYTLFNVLLSDAAIGPDKRLVRTQTAEARSSFGWIILIFLAVCVFFTVRFSGLFTAYRYAIEEAIEELQEFVASRKLTYQYTNAVVAAAKEWDTRQKNVGTFITQTLFAAGSLSLPILISFAAVVTWAGFMGYIDELVPISLRDFFRGFAEEKVRTPQ